MIPLHLKTPDLVEPADTTYYLLAANGVFLVKKAGLFSSVTAASALAGLEPQRPALTLTFPRLPRGILETIYGFFRFVYERLDGEAIVFIYYSIGRREFRVDAPPQELRRHRTRRGWSTEGRVEYQSLPRPEGFLKLGDAHSHGDSPAFFSSTDDRDDGEDGLRIVMGRLDRARPDVRVSFVANRTRFDLDPEDVLEDFTRPSPPPDRWTGRVSCRYEDLNERTHHENARR